MESKGNPSTKIHQLTVDLLLPGDQFPRTRLRFFGSDREEAEEQLVIHAERDRALRELVLEGRDESDEGLVMRTGWKLVDAEKVKRGTYG